MFFFYYVKIGLWSYSNYIMISFLLENIFTTDHKKIGKIYILLGAMFGFLGFVLSIIIRLQLSDFLVDSVFSKGADIVLYNIIITLHGIIMIFFLLCLF